LDLIGEGFMQSGMLLIWIGALLIVGGIVLAAGQVLWKARERVRALHPKHHWPSIVMVALGIVLLLAEAAV
jgi:hypothetical protein